MGPRLFTVFLIWLYGVAPQAGATLTSERAKALERFKSQCESGVGKACYDYGRSLWSTPGATDRPTSLRYLRRGCELKYKLACESYDDHSAKLKKVHKPKIRSQSVTLKSRFGRCFQLSDLKSAQISANQISPAVTRGQRFERLDRNSFWTGLGLEDHDIIVLVNDQPFNTRNEVIRAFNPSFKTYDIEIERVYEAKHFTYTCP